MKLMIIIIMYFLFIALVPESPSYYRFLVDTVGSILSLLSLIFLQLYLKSRPLNQKTIFNSQLQLVVYLHMVCTVRGFIGSTATSLFHKKIVMLFDSDPLMFINLFLLRPHVIALMTAYCSTSISKLMLLISTVTFQNLSAKKGFWITLVAVFGITVLDIILIELKCGYNNKETHDQFDYRLILQFELGMMNKTFKRAEENINSTIEDGHGKLHKADKVCTFFPIMQIVCCLTIILEITKLTIVVLLEVRKLFKLNNTNTVPSGHFPPLENPQYKMSAESFQLEISRSEIVLNPTDLKQHINKCSRRLGYENPASEIDCSTNSTNNIAATSVKTNATVGVTPVIVEDTTDAVETSTSEGADDIRKETEKEASIETEETVPTKEDRSTAPQKILEPYSTATVQQSARSSGHSDKTITGTIKNALRLILYRAATLSLVLFLLFIVTYISVYKTNKGKKSFLPWFLVLLSRLMTYFVPVADILYDKDMRLYTFLKVKQLLQRYLQS